MAHKEMTLSEAVEYIKSNDDPFVEFGFRTDDFIPGEKFNNSWYHGVEMPEYELPGVSVIKVMAKGEPYINKAYNLVREVYGDKYTFLLEGECENADELTGDYGEALMVEHKIVAIIR